MPRNLAIVGYGKMGRLIEQLAPEAGFSVGLKLDIDTNVNQEGITPENFRGVDVAIEFSTPHTAVANLERLCAIGVPTIVGTTGWYGELERVRGFVDQCGVGVVYSPNYSIGVNVFRRVVAEAARLLASQPEYGAWAWEVHHAAKKDAPSGTLLQLVEEMQRAGYTRRIDASSNRAGANPGTHEIGFDSAADTITLRHTARSREGFARGALKAAQWVIGKRGLHEFGEVIFADDAKAMRRPANERGGNHVSRICGLWHGAGHPVPEGLVARRRSGAATGAPADRGGINFLVPCGTTGESPTLSHEEHLRVVAITLEEAKGKVPVLAGAGGYDTRTVIEMARECERMGADGILSVTPYYNKPTQEGLYHHYKAIASAISLPSFCTTCRREPTSTSIPQPCAASRKSKTLSA